MYEQYYEDMDYEMNARYDHINELYAATMADMEQEAITAEYEAICAASMTDPAVLEAYDCMAEPFDYDADIPF